MEKAKRYLHIYALTFIAFLLGSMIMCGIFTHKAAADKEERDNRELAQYIEDLEARNTHMEQQINNMRLELSELETSQEQGEDQLKYLNERLARLNMQAELTPLTGQGIKITLNDNVSGASQEQNSAHYAPEHYLIHDKDILYLIRGLSAASEACSVNGIRITDTTAIRCAGNIILINGSRLAPPYEINIIGNSEELEKLLLANGTYLSLTYRGLPIEYKICDKVEIPAYVGAYSDKYSKTAE